MIGLSLKERSNDVRGGDCNGRILGAVDAAARCAIMSHLIWPGSARQRPSGTNVCSRPEVNP